MIKKKLKRLLEYCPKPPEPLTTTLKRYSIPITIIVSISIALTSFFLFYFAPAQSTIPPPLTIVTEEYNPGVSVGDYVTYGNFVCNREHPEGCICINDLAFKKVEVIEVSGKEVTFLHTQQFKNGSETPLNGCMETWDVEKAVWSENTDVYTESTLIIAANLTEGNSIQSDPCPLLDYYVAETDVRTYLGVNRNVAIFHFHELVDNNRELCNVTVNVVFDQESGIRLEHELVTLDGDIIASMSIVDTNIFSTPSASTISSVYSFQKTPVANVPALAFYVATVLVIIVILVVAFVIFRKKGSRGGEKNNE
jgi:hypothetical protein